MSFDGCQHVIGSLVIQIFCAAELMKHLMDYGCRNDQLLDIFDLSIQKPIFCEENWWVFCGVVDLERGDDCGYGGIGGLGA
uniref:Uncharacterized protein n=1 Tax=Romanomermis culicivorax TaxID=13658 RepID=A0A915HTW2_ROMCU